MGGCIGMYSIFQSACSSVSLLGMFGYSLGLSVAATCAIHIFSYPYLESASRPSQFVRATRLPMVHLFVCPCTSAHASVHALRITRRNMSHAHSIIHYMPISDATCIMAEQLCDHNWLENLQQASTARVRVYFFSASSPLGGRRTGHR